MREIKGDIIKVFQEAQEADLIHQVNTHMVMGSGLALQIKKAYPQHYQDYVEHGERHRPYLIGTSVHSFVDPDSDKVICGVFGQETYGRTGRHTNYAALFRGLANFIDDQPLCLIPKYIGCGLGGGDWEIVHTFLYDLDKITKSEIIIVDGSGL